MDQRLKASAIQRQIFRELPVYDRADRCVLRIYQRRTAGDRDGFRCRTQRHLEIKLDGVLHVENHIRFHDGFEAGFLHFNTIVTGRDRGNEIRARLVCRSPVADVGVVVDGCYFRLDDDRL